MASCHNLLDHWTNLCHLRYLYRGVAELKNLNDFPYAHVLVLGLAKSGTAAAKLLLSSQIKVRVNDFNTDESSALITDLKNQGAEVIIGSHPLSVLEGKIGRASCRERV